MVLLNEKYLIIRYHQDTKCMIQEWHGFATSAQFRQGVNDYITLMKEYETLSLIADVRFQGAVKLEDSDWASREALPKMFKIGLKKICFVLPGNVFSQVSVDNFTQKSEKLTRVKYFDNFEQAYAWAAGVPAVW